MAKQENQTKDKLNIAIIGYGRFGRILAEILYPFGKIFIISQRQIKNKKVKQIDYADLKLMDWVIPAVPISALKKTLKKISPNLAKGSLVMDVSSVKVYPCQWLKKYLPKNMEILGTHPMFGPDSAKYGLDGMQMVICPVRVSSKRLKQVINIFRKLGLKIIKTTSQKHDRQSAVSLAMVHFVGRGLEKIGIKEQEISTLGFKILLQVCENVNNDTWELFYDMHHYNPYAKKIRESFLRSLQEVNLMLSLDIWREIDSLDVLRKKINMIDKDIFNLFKQRFILVNQIGKIKRKDNLPIKDRKREQEMINRIVKQANLDKKFIMAIYKLIFSKSCSLQQKRRKKLC